MRILIADDERDFAAYLSLMVEDAGHEVARVVTTGGPGAVLAYDDCIPDIVLMDIMMPLGNGITSTRQILSRNPGARVILMSGMLDTVSLQATAAKAGAAANLHKPFSQAHLQEVITTLGSEVQ